MRTLSRRALLALGGALLGSAAQAAGPRIHVVTMDRMAFGPVPKDLKAGDVIEWVNRDLFRHTATARDRRFDVDLAPKARGRSVLRAAGRIEVYCRFHPAMKTVLQVRP